MTVHKLKLITTFTSICMNSITNSSNTHIANDTKKINTNSMYNMPYSYYMDGQLNSVWFKCSLNKYFTVKRT